MNTATLLNPAQAGMIECDNCHGYGSSLTESALKCSKCEGTGLVRAPEPESASGSESYIYIGHVWSDSTSYLDSASFERHKVVHDIAQFCRHHWESDWYSPDNDDDDDNYLDDDFVIETYFEHMDEEHFTIDHVEITR
jgi:hypothetical protein